MTSRKPSLYSEAEVQDRFREINDLRLRVAALQQKTESQTALLTSSSREITGLRRLLAENGVAAPASTAATDLGASPAAATAGGGGGGAASGAAARRRSDTARATQNQSELSYRYAVLEQQLAESKRSEQQLRQDLDAQRAESESLQHMVANLKSATTTLEREKRRLDQKLTDQQDAAASSSLRTQAGGGGAGGIDDDGTTFAQYRGEALASRKTIAALRRRLMAISTSANAKYGELQNKLEASRAFVDELRREYEEFVEQSKAEHEAFRTLANKEYDDLRLEFENYKLIQYEDKKQLIHEQQGVLYAMQTQFDEYRTTAEFLFNTEAAKLEEKLNSQMEKYDQEIKAIIRSKDRMYDAMITAKDAKIMTLIEGSDIQAITERHETELDALRKGQVEELNRQRQQHDADMQQVSVTLRNNLMEQQAAVEVLRNQNRALEHRLSDAQSALAQRSSAMRDAERRHGEAASAMQQQIDHANRRLQEFGAERASLRHAIVRLKVGHRAGADVSLKSMVLRLEEQIGVLSKDHQELTVRHNSALAEGETLDRKLKFTLRELEQSRAQGEVLKRETRQMAAAFETFLQTRFKGVRKSAFGTRPASTSTSASSSFLPPIAPASEASEASEASDKSAQAVVRDMVDLANRVVGGDTGDASDGAATEDGKGPAPKREVLDMANAVLGDEVGAHPAPTPPAQGKRPAKVRARIPRTKVLATQDDVMEELQTALHFLQSFQKSTRKAMATR